MSAINNRRGPIPGVAIAIAVPVFFLCLAFFLRTFGRDETPPPIAVQVLLGILMGTLAAGYVLLAGYVNRDARRRGMRHVLWTFIVLLVPNAIGFILYFLLRQPLLGSCPNCRTTVKPDFNYCPQCHYQLKPVCPGCGKTSEPGIQYCPYCGTSFSPAAPAAVPQA